MLLTNSSHTRSATKNSGLESAPANTVLVACSEFDKGYNYIPRTNHPTVD